MSFTFIFKLMKSWMDVVLGCWSECPTNLAAHPKKNDFMCRFERDGRLGWIRRVDVSELRQSFAAFSLEPRLGFGEL